MTVKAGATNQAPVAVGTIPGSSLQIGSSSTIDAAGYFSDADGDELTYTGSSSNEGVATVSMEGSSATITAVSAGDAVITITASDGSASASQGFTVTVAAEPVNNPPVAVGTIPGSTLEIGGMSTIDAAGYFSDADGDELSYTGSSSNPGVATVAMEGSSATITAVAAGDAVITITASDGEASVSQGFRVDVNAGPEEATVVISRLLDDSRNTIGDPTGIARTIHVVLDVQSNDETWTDIGLTMNGETVMPMCRGTGGSAGDAAPGPGLAAAGQAEIECLLRTNAVEGMCEGMPLDPTYANGAYQLGAFLMTDAGERREVIAPLPIALKNSNRVDVAFVPGGNHVLDRGIPIYGGPSSEEDMSAFHACPVSFDGTEVGTISLVANSTGPAGATPHQAGTSLSFTEPTTMPAKTFNGEPADRTGPFTWDVNSEWNGTVEDEGPGGREHWVLVEKIENAAGLDVRGDFGTAPAGPYYFDFKAPVPGVIHIGGAEAVAGTHYSDKAYADKSTNTIRLSSIMDGGVGVDSTTIMIGVGDCSAEANLYNAKTKMPDRTMTPFEAVKTFAGKDQGHVSMLDEEDANRAGPGKDDNGLDCYVAELTGLADKLGNEFDGGKTPADWLQTANFGVDKTAADLDDIEPDLAGLVFKEEPEMEFEVRNPDLASGDDGTALTAMAMWGKGYALDAGDVMLPETGIEATVDLDASVTEEEGAKSVRVTVSDGAMPPNMNGYTFGFTFDETAATYSIASTQGNITPGSASSVQVSVDGTVTDKFSNLETAELRLLIVPAGGECFAGTLADLEELEGLGADATEAEQASRDAVILPGDRLGGSGKNKHKRSLADGSAKSASLNSTFTIMRAGAGESAPQTYCFRLDVEDVARTAGARASSTGNTATFTVGPAFTVEWPDNTPPPPVDYSIVFTDADGEALEMVTVDEGSGTIGTTYNVALSNWPEGAADDAEVEVAIAVTSGRSVYAQLSADELTFDGSNFSTAQAVTITTVNNDAGAVGETFTLTHTPSGLDNFAAADLSGAVNDDEIALSVTGLPMRFGENDGDTVEVTLTAMTAVPDTAAADRTFDVTLATGDASDVTWYSDEEATTSITTVTITLAMDVGMVDTTIYVVPTDDAVMNEGAEEIDVTGGAVSGGSIAGGTLQTGASVAAVATNIVLNDDDPDVTLSTDPEEVAEDAGTQVVEVTVTESNGAMVNTDRTVTVTVAAPTAGTGVQYELSENGVAGTFGATALTLTVELAPGVDSGTATFHLKPTPDATRTVNGEVGISATIANADASGNKANGVAYTVGTATIVVANTDSS